MYIIFFAFFYFFLLRTVLSNLLSGSTTLEYNRFLKEKMSVYGKISYWNERYSNEVEQFDWHQKWHGVKHIFKDLNIKSDAKILNVGCGTSKFSEEMLDNGYKDITNIDASTVCIDKMKEKYSNRPDMKYILMDVCNMKEFNDEQFDLIIDKACLDSILCSEQSGKNSEEMLSEISRILKPEGYYVIISHAQPSYRLGYIQLTEYKWEVSVRTVQRPMLGFVMPPVDDNLHYVYICKKKLYISDVKREQTERNETQTEQINKDQYGSASKEVKVKKEL